MTVATTVSPASRAGVAQRQGQHGQDLVAVDDLAGGVDGQAAVGVAVVRDPGVGAVLDHGGRQRVQVGGAAALVDVQPVRVGADRDDLGAGPAQQAGRELVGGPVRAVHDHPQPGQRRRPPCRAGHGGQQVVQVALALVGGVPDPAEPALGHARGPGRPGRPRRPRRPARRASICVLDARRAASRRRGRRT